jgi:NADPH:quinone reductase-like Zn-dependent oxidoreductase
VRSLDIEIAHEGLATRLLRSSKRLVDRKALTPCGSGPAHSAITAGPGAVGSIVTPLARLAGAYVIGTGRGADRQTALDFGAQVFVDLENDALEDVGSVDLCSISSAATSGSGPRAWLEPEEGWCPSGRPTPRPAEGLVVDFVVESDRAQFSEIVQRVRDGRLRTNVGTVSTLDDAVAAFNPTERRSGKTIIRVRP